MLSRCICLSRLQLSSVGVACYHEASKDSPRPLVLSTMLALCWRCELRVITRTRAGPEEESSVTSCKQSSQHIPQVSFLTCQAKITTYI